MYSIVDEITFLFEDVIKVNVLRHAEAFRQHGATDFLAAVRQSERFAEEVLSVLPQQPALRFDSKSIKTPPGYREAWRLLTQSDIIKMLIPQEYGGRNFPETVKMAIREILLTANPSFYLYLMLTLEVADLIDRYGTTEAKKEYCQKLFAGEWTGAFSFSEPQTDRDLDIIEAAAKESGGQFSISATKTFTVAGNHDLTDNVVHLVLSRYSSKGIGKEQLAWFIVSCQGEGESDHATNHVEVDSCHDTMGLTGAPFCTMTYGKNGVTKGHLLTKIGDEDASLFQTFNGIRSQMALYGVGLSSQVFQEALIFSCKEAKPASLITYPHIADHIMFIKSFTEGIRAAVYSITFFRDCSAHGGKEQQEFFSELTDLYVGVLKVHATKLGLDAIKRGTQILGRNAYTSQSITDTSFRDLQAATLFGGANEIVAQELLERLVNYKNGAMIDTLIKQFASIDVSQVRSDPLKEAVRVWQDYIGGLILLTDDLKKTVQHVRGSEEVDPRMVNLFAGRIVTLIGDVIVCYHLISQGLEAEKKLEHLGVNFYNLQQDVSRDPMAMPWYDRLLSAEYFALNVLSENESNIRIIQRNASSALEAFFSSTTER